MSDESVPRVRAECSHQWERVNGSVERHCQKCNVSWEKWVEERMSGLMKTIERLEEALEEARESDEIDVAFVTLLPPQTEYTCRACDGTGQLPLFEYALICSVCLCHYTSDSLEGLTEESALPCGHNAGNIMATSDCVECKGTGTK